MNEKTFKAGITACAALFLGVLIVYTLPAAIADGDIIAAFAGGFVNPYATGYSIDVIMCWGILFFWVAYEQSLKGVKGGWYCLLLGIFPGVAVGFALYLFIRAKQIEMT